MVLYYRRQSLMDLSITSAFLLHGTPPILTKVFSLLHENISIYWSLEDFFDMHLHQGSSISYVSFIIHRICNGSHQRTIHCTIDPGFYRIMPSIHIQIPPSGRYCIDRTPISSSTQESAYVLIGAGLTHLPLDKLVAILAHYFRLHFIDLKLQNADWNFTEIRSQELNLQ